MSNFIKFTFDTYFNLKIILLDDHLRFELVSNYFVYKKPQFFCNYSYGAYYYYEIVKFASFL